MMNSRSDSIPAANVSGGADRRAGARLRQACYLRLILETFVEAEIDLRVAVFLGRHFARQRLKDKIYGQDDAVDTVAGAIKLAKAGLKNPNQPIGSYMMVGSSGVGKSYLAECLAEDLYGDPEALTVFDMSEYMERQNLSRLIGSTPGLVGYGDGGKLTNAVRARPYQIILFDEIEKAHPDTFKILLQVLDKGRLSDELGQVDFRNTIILMTTNLAKHLSFEPERNSENSRDEIIESVRTIFPQELVNRVDGYILFKAHNLANIERIIGREMKGLNKQLTDRNMQVTLSDSDIATLAKDKYVPEEGARQVVKFMKNKMTNQIADIVLGHPQGKQGGAIDVRYVSESNRFDLNFTPKAAESGLIVPATPKLIVPQGGAYVGGGAVAMRQTAAAAFAPMFH